MPHSTANKGGFTLIELLVVISIIGLLSTLAVVGFNNARISARDTRRKADLKQIQNALEIYYDRFNAYPSESWCDSSRGSDGASDCPVSGSDWDYTTSIAKTLKDNVIIGSLPKDPLNDSSHYYQYEPECYQGRCQSDCCYYWIRVNLERGGLYTLEGGKL